eukprot:NODE_186_length_13589_cov_0.385545.p8 type:complete len:231 gc:universal NODE_186_length_13589_cov_0.385545:8302-8994(+)
MAFKSTGPPNHQMFKNHSSKTHILRCLLVILTLLTLLYGIYQFLVAEWTLAVLWTVAALAGMVAIFAKTTGLVLTSMAIYLSFLLAGFVCDIVFLSLLQRHVDDSYPAQSIILRDGSRNSVEAIIILTLVLGIIFSILLSILTAPVFILLARSLKKDSKKYGTSAYDSYNRAGERQPIANQQPVSQQPIQQQPMQQQQVPQQMPQQYTENYAQPQGVNGGVPTYNNVQQY